MVRARELQIFLSVALPVSAELSRLVHVGGAFLFVLSSLNVLKNFSKLRLDCPLVNLYLENLQINNSAGIPQITLYS